MEINPPDDQGIVYRKSTGQYDVHAGQHSFPCSLAPQITQPAAVGDRVRFTRRPDGSRQIVEVLPRQTQLSRQAVTAGFSAQEQVIVANLDQVVPVFAAANPAPKWGLLDRYLVSAEAAGVAALICINKLDLLPDDTNLAAGLAPYRQAGYPVVLVSARDGSGLAELRAALQNRCSVLLGKSGVGKSSLLNALLPGLELRTQALSGAHRADKKGNRQRGKNRDKQDRGRHTTTHLELYPLPGGGGIVDTPGVRQFGLWDLAPEELAGCFPEMRPWLGQCKFGASCRHDSEPGCTVRQAVMQGQIHPLRYRSYMRLLEDLR